MRAKCGSASIANQSNKSQRQTSDSPVSSPLDKRRCTSEVDSGPAAQPPSDTYQPSLSGVDIAAAADFADFERVRIAVDKSASETVVERS
jgi:hypothetical protein